MAENRKSNVGVVLINNLGVYNKNYFVPLQNIWGKADDHSFLIANLQYFYNTNSTLEPPHRTFENSWRPPEYGKPLFLIKENQVAVQLARQYVATYSLDGKFGKIADKCYICAPDIEKICKYISSRNPIMQRRASQIMARDKVVIDLLYTALEVSEDISDKTLREKTIRPIFDTIIDGLKVAPLSYKFDLPSVLLDRDERIRLANKSEQRYAEITQNATKSVFREVRALEYGHKTQTR